MALTSPRIVIPMHLRISLDVICYCFDNILFSSVTRGAQPWVGLKRLKKRDKLVGNILKDAQENAFKDSMASSRGTFPTRRERSSLAMGQQFCHLHHRRIVQNLDARTQYDFYL